MPTGFTSLPQAITRSARHVFSISYPLGEFLSGGLGGSGAGFGGSGGTGFWSALFLIIVTIVTAVLIGCLNGLFVHLAIKALVGATKAYTKELVLQVLQEPADVKSDYKGRPIRQEIVRGALTGVFVGLMEALFTLWGIITFYHPRIR